MDQKQQQQLQGELVSSSAKAKMSQMPMPPFGHSGHSPARVRMRRPSMHDCPASFFRKNRDKIMAISSSSSVRRPVRLRRLNKNLAGVGTSSKQASSKASSSSASSAAPSSPNSKGKQTKAKRMPAPPLSPMQIMVRRLYEKINRRHKSNVRDSKFQVWKQNRDSVDELTREHHRIQAATASSAALMSNSRRSATVTAHDILNATSEVASYKATTTEHAKVLVIPEASLGTSFKGSQDQSRGYQKVPITTISHVHQIPPVLDWTAIPHNLHEDDGKFLTNIPFLGDEFIDKDAKFIDEMVTLYEGNVHEAKDKESQNFKKMDDEVLYNLVQAMVKIEIEEGPNVFKDESLSVHVEKLELEEEGEGDNNGWRYLHLNIPPKKTTFSELAAKLFQSPEKNESFASRQPSLPDSDTPPPVLSPQNVKHEATYHDDIIDEGIAETDGAIKADLKSETDTKHEETGEEMETLQAELPVFKEERGVGEHSQNNGAGVNDLHEGNESSNTSSNSSKPSEQIFNLLSTTFKGLGSASEVRERYDNIEKTRAIPPLPILSNGMEEQKPESYLIPNIEGPFAKYQSKEDTMHAYRVLFCRRCYTYDCKRHNGDDQVDVKYYKNRRAQSSPMAGSSASASSSSAFNFLCKNPDCWQLNDIVPRTSEEILTEWSPGDRSLFLCFIDSFPGSYCFISYLMRNKSCAQVKEYADLENVPKMKSSPKSVTCRRSKHRKSKGFNKKSSGTSGSKRKVTRRWIHSVKKTEKGKEEGGAKSIVGGKLPARYIPCIHENGGECDSSCTCRINKTSCEKFCTCALTCPYRFPGCTCLSTCDSKRCICFAAARECDPDLCVRCGAHEIEMDKITCRNVNIQRKAQRHILMGESDISGWGIYIKDNAQKGDFIAEYRGELISYDESERRGHVYDKIQHTFLFELNDHFVVDATRKGNKARFVNSSKNPNCEVKRMLVNGDHRIGIYAKRFIEAGEELFYDYEDVLEKQQKAADGNR